MNAVPERRAVNLALQGGGAHGAFTWGVLDRLLDEERLEFEGISATSAGAMNGTVLAHGLATGGRAGAKAALERFWMKIADAARSSPMQPSWLDVVQGNWTLPFSPAFGFFDLLSRFASPYELNPLGLNPLRDILSELIDFAPLRRADAPVKLFLSATNVRSGKVKVFERDEIGVDAVLASACLPFMFQAVEIDGEAYWDGGYMGNPAIFPLIYECDSPDVVLVHVNPLTRPTVPRTATEIMNRVNEISFNSSLMREMRAIHFVTSLIDSGQLQGRDMKRLRLHAIADDAAMVSLSATSKMNAERSFLRHLQDVGRRAADAWLARNWAEVGVRSSVDIRDVYL